jgi:uncharacterized alkaline shock family protein YloU
MHDGQATISSDILARYAADAAREVDGVAAVTGRRGVKVGESDGAVHVEIHIAVRWGAPIPAVGAAVQQRVHDYLARMTTVKSSEVDVVVDDVEAP